MSEETILPEDPRAASLQQVTGWVANGKFFGSNEEWARLEGATHIRCKQCSAIISKRSWTVCDACREKQEQHRHSLLPVEEWDHESPVYAHDTGRWFYGIEELEEYLDDHDERPSLEGLQLVHSESRWAEIEVGNLAPFDQEDFEPTAAVRAIIDEANAKLRACRDASYYEPIQVAVDINKLRDELYPKDKECPVCKAVKIRRDYDYPDTMMCCETCGSDWVIGGDVTFNAKEHK